MKLSSVSMVLYFKKQKLKSWHAKDGLLEVLGGRWAVYGAKCCPGKGTDGKERKRREGKRREKESNGGLGTIWRGKGGEVCLCLGGRLP